MESIDQRWTELWDKSTTAGYDSLSLPEKDWVNLRSLIESIENGGVISYFYNSGADRLSDCLGALRRIAASQVLTQVQKVCDLFPGGVPPDIDARNDVINSWADSAQGDKVDALLEDIDSHLMPLMTDLEKRLSKSLQDQGLAT